MQWIYDTLLGHRGFNDWYTMSFYFFPVILNLIAGIFLFIKTLQSDFAARQSTLDELSKETKSSDRVYDYHKYMTIGSVVYYLFLGTCPVCSTWMALFESLPYLCHLIHIRFQWVFDIQFVKSPIKPTSK